MKKKAISLALIMVLAISAVGCSSNNDNVSEENKNKTIENIDVLPGKWSQDYTREEVQELYEKALASVESTAKGYSLDYTITEDEIKEENGESVNDTYVYFDIPDAERLESLYFGFKQYGSDLSSGKLEMKLGYKLNKQLILEAGKFEFENISLSAFSQAFTGDYDRDYTELNKQIYEAVKNSNDSSIETITNNVDGLKETITITQDFLLYKLESKVYNFK